MDQATEILKRVKRIQLRARRLAVETFAGHYHSGFRGQGLDFDDFREYIAGDDPRFIDWKVTARMRTPYVRRFNEEREQALILAIDGSASMRYGSAASTQTKLEYAAEVAAVLAYSAAQNGDKCGLLIYGQGDAPFYLPPAKGVKQTMRIVREILTAHAGKADTPIADVSKHLVSAQKKMVMVVMISDFWSAPDTSALGKINFKHELIPVRIADPLELQLPEVGSIVLCDPETNEQFLVATQDDALRTRHHNLAHSHRESWAKEFKRLGIDYLDLSTTEPYLPALKSLFGRRSRKFSR